MLRLLASRNFKEQGKKEKKKETNITELDNVEFKYLGSDIKDLKNKEHNLHILDFTSYKNISCIDEIIPEYINSFFNNKNSSKLRILLFNKNLELTKIIKNSVYYWNVINENVIESSNIDIVQVVGSHCNPNSDVILNISKLYIENIENTGCLIILKLSDDISDKLKYLNKDNKKVIIYNNNEEIDFIIEHTSENYQFFYLKHSKPNDIRQNYNYFTSKKQELVKKYFENILNEYIILLHPIFHKLIKKERLTIIQILNITNIIGNENLEASDIRDYLSSQFYNFTNFFSITNNEIDTLVGTFMEAMDCSDDNLLSKFLTEKMNPLLVSHYNYFYLYKKNNNNNLNSSVVHEDEYDSSSSYYTSEEDN
ncbi:hypothetical protein CPAV1605_913 [seawater metagenome]|uniref:Uncharacterized protein n=1 Tax=seawater metagenome TaxID=1561972 RepID=A0A5E8CII3_9ZZZZ